MKINPRDVVSIPSDYNDAKGRACRYEVVGEVGVNPDDNAEFSKPVQTNANSVPVKREPKLGSTPFYKGYTDGYEGNEYGSGALWTKTDLDNYEQGYEKGQMHSEDGNDPRYKYIIKSTTNSWPLPKSSY